MGKAPYRFYLVAAGKYHNIDFARLEILKLLSEDERFRVQVGDDYSNIEAIQAADVLITYTCDVIPTEEEQAGLHDFLSNGGKWFALHGTNSILRFLEDGRVDTPDEAPKFMEMLGSQFAAHPPIMPYTVHVTEGQEEHPLVKGVESFEVDDELYCCNYIGENTAYIQTEWNGTCDGFTDEDWTDEAKVTHLVMYTHDYHGGEVLYLTLGHCRGKYDMQPMIEEYPTIEEGAWAQPVYYDLLRRGIRYCIGELQ